jgi:hypothetical protein
MKAMKRRSMKATRVGTRSFGIYSLPGVTTYKGVYPMNFSMKGEFPKL